MTTKFDIVKLKSQATLGNVEAMFILGCNYLYGVGVEVDLNKAHSFRKTTNLLSPRKRSK